MFFSAAPVTESIDMSQSMRVAGALHRTRHILLQKELDRFRFLPLSKQTTEFRAAAIEIPCVQPYHTEFIAQVWQRTDARDILSLGFVCPLLNETPSPYYLMVCKVRGLQPCKDAAAHVGGVLHKDFVLGLPENALYMYANDQATN
jgi:hypothetical protein